MPLFDYQCSVGHRHEHYVHAAREAHETTPCRTCGAVAIKRAPLFAALNFFSESNGQVINNLAPGVPIHSHKQHQDLMKANGLEPATDWHVSKRL